MLDIEKLIGKLTTDPIMPPSPSLALPSTFEGLWKKGIDARDRISDIEEGRSVNMEIIPNADESLKLYCRL